MSDFLPKEYEPKKVTGKYTKFANGVTRIRIMSASLVGYEYFDINNKPIRSKEKFISTPWIKAEAKVKEFWAFIVWNYWDSKQKIDWQFQICEITQSSIKNAIYALYIDKDYWDPKKYDLKVNKSGTTKDDTTYSVIPWPISEVNDDIMSRFLVEKINIEVLFTGGDPFNS